MTADTDRAFKLKGRIIIFGGLLAGLVMLAVAMTTDHPPVELWVIGGLLVLAFGYSVSWGIWFRIRYPTREARDEYKQRFLAGETGGNPETARTYLANRAAKHRDEVLRTGIDASAVVVFMADGHMRKGFGHLVCLELDVTVGDAPPRRVSTGEYISPVESGILHPGARLAVKVHPTDPDRVAVDWERSLRWPSP